MPDCSILKCCSTATVAFIKSIWRWCGALSISVVKWLAKMAKECCAFEVEKHQSNSLINRFTLVANWAHEKAPGTEVKMWARLFCWSWDFHRYMQYQLKSCDGVVNPCYDIFVALQPLVQFDETLCYVAQHDKITSSQFRPVSLGKSFSSLCMKKAISFLCLRTALQLNHFSFVCYCTLLCSMQTSFKNSDKWLIQASCLNVHCCWDWGHYIIQFHGASWWIMQW